jgi:Alpha-2-macroglobulin bait region domain
VEKHAQPGEAVTLSLTTSSKSLCALSGVDRAVTFLDKRRALSTDEIFERLETFNEQVAYNTYIDYMVEECSSGNHCKIIL